MGVDVNAPKPVDIKPWMPFVVAIRLDAPPDVRRREMWNEGEEL